MEDRKQPQVGSPWLVASLVVAMSLLATFTLSKPTQTSAGGPGPAGVPTEVVEDGGDGGGGGDGAPDPTGTGAPDPARTRDGTSGDSGDTASKYDCAKGRNAGATDWGVTARTIKFAATVVKTGIAKDFLFDAQFGIEAVRQKVNRGGGICGRTIEIDYKNDEWNPTKGQQIIESWIGSEDYFGLAVNPSSEGLRGPIDSGLIRSKQFPVIGADGMLIDQYTDPWVWPVATSTASVMHIMAHDAYKRGARSFGIVWEYTYRFGQEGHDAFVGAVKRLAGPNAVASDAKIQGGQTSYTNEVNTFISGCGGSDSLDECDFVALLLEPNTASTWVRDKGLGDGVHRPKTGIGAPQPLFLDSFARNCGADCANMWVWTSFKPPIDPFDSDPAVVAYRTDLRNVSQTADANNPHVEGAYVGMQLVVEALRKIGPAPTRAGIKGILDSLTLDTGLAPPITFRGADHNGHASAQAFVDIVNNGSFSTWRYAATGFIRDPDLGKDV